MGQSSRRVPTPTKLSRGEVSSGVKEVAEATPAERAQSPRGLFSCQSARGGHEAATQDRLLICSLPRQQRQPGDSRARFLSVCEAWARSDSHSSHARLTDSPPSHSAPAIGRAPLNLLGANPASVSARTGTVRWHVLPLRTGGGEEGGSSLSVFTSVFTRGELGHYHVSLLDERSEISMANIKRCLDYKNAS